jgi:hypothetical protein
MSKSSSYLNRLCIFIAVILLVGCSAPKTLPAGPDAVWDLVVIGDSSMWELGPAFASQIEKDRGLKVTLEDFALPTLSAGEVLEVLETGKSVRARLEDLPAALKEAEVVVMFVNPVNSIDPAKPLNMNGCFYNVEPEACDMDRFTQYIADLESIWGKIIELRDGQPVILRATDLYNPLVSGWQESGVFETCTACWENLSAASRQAADSYGIPFLSRLDAFDGVDHSEDPREKGYIREDGEHPSQLGAEFTARLLSDMGYEPVARKE